MRLMFWKKEKEPPANLPEIKTGSVREIKESEKLTFKDEYKLKFKPTISFLVTMFFSNGTSKQFVISTKEETFDYNKRTYYLRYEDAWYDLSFKQYRLFFFDDSAVPINRAIEKRGNKNYFTVTPENLKPLIKMEYVKALAMSHELSKYLKMGLLFAFINMMLSVIIAFYMYQMHRLLAQP